MLYLRTVYEKEKLKGDRVKPDPPFKKPKNLQIWGSKILLFIKKKKSFWNRNGNSFQCEVENIAWTILI